MSKDRWADLRDSFSDLYGTDDAWMTWRVVDDDDTRWVVLTSDDYDICLETADDERPAIATYIAAADPITIAALLAERDAVVSRADWLEAALARLVAGWRQDATIPLLSGTPAVGVLNTAADEVEALLAEGTGEAP